jgi:hypothetical protein
MIAPVTAGDNDSRSGGAVSGVAATNGQTSFAMRRRALYAARPRSAAFTPCHLPAATSALPADLRIRTEADHRDPSRLASNRTTGATRTAYSDRTLRHWVKRLRGPGRAC